MVKQVESAQVQITLAVDHEGSATGEQSLAIIIGAFFVEEEMAIAKTAATIAVQKGGFIKIVELATHRENVPFIEMLGQQGQGFFLQFDVDFLGHNGWGGLMEQLFDYFQDFEFAL